MSDQRSGPLDGDVVVRLARHVLIVVQDLPEWTAS